jgi:hypothetical protein
MLLVAKAAAPFFEGAHFYYGIGAVVAVITFAKITGITRVVRKRWTNWRNWILVRDGKAAITVNGVPVSPVILSIPVRLKNLDDGQLKIINDLDEYKRQHGAQVAAIATSVEQVATSQVRLEEKIIKLFPNGENTNDPGDLLSRTAKAVGAYIDNPEPITHDRREGDQKEET